MSETPQEPTAEAPAEQPAEGPAEDTTDWKAEARKWEQRAKENRAAVAELDKQRKASMTEADRAIAEAETRGRTTAVAEFGKRLARTEFDAAAARRNPDVDTAAVLEYVDLGRFVDDSGEPDTKAIAAAVERLVPVASGTDPAPLDLGQRQNPPARQDFNKLLRSAAGRA